MSYKASAFVSGADITVTVSDLARSWTTTARQFPVGWRVGLVWTDADGELTVAVPQEARRAAQRAVAELVETF